MASKVVSLFNIFALSSLIFILTKNTHFLSIKNETKKALGYPINSLLNFTELSAKYGYTSEEHTVQTKDGYLLKMFRIVKGRNCHEAKKSPPVLLVHGFLQNSDIWFDAGPNAGLAFLIPDECHDLWVANCRGNSYSRAHITLNPDKDPQFWHFTTDEIGLYDLPAMIDYVLHKTGSEKLNHVGFSQGSGTLFSLCSAYPDYCEKVQLTIGISPGVKLGHIRSVFIRLLTQGAMVTEGLLNKLGMYEFLPKGGLVQQLGELICQSTVTRTLCIAIQAVVDSYHPGSLSEETQSSFLRHFPTGSSLRNFAQIGQRVWSNKFQKYDYGTAGNLQAYGSADPPAYNLSAVSIPVVIIHGAGDRLVDIKDTQWLVAQLPNVLEEVVIADPLWNHIDGTYSQLTKELLFPKIKEYLNKYSFSAS